MFSAFRRAKPNPEALKQIAQWVQNEISTNKVVVFSKSYCPYCKQAKQVLNAELGSGKYKVIEIENKEDCSEIQDYLSELTGGRTVPRVFVGGQCIGGGSETASLQSSGQLHKLLQSVGAL